MNWLEAIAWVAGGLFTIVSIAVFSLMALFVFADRAAAKETRNKK